ncbi:MAG TPA: alpha/beta hydrolase [Acidimicrobiales bacterium]|nr:alpha/beta hydrolase [Acidimicrobiales bacterium]
MSSSGDDATVEPPAWFRRALAHEPEVHRVSCEGVDISYLAWGRLGAPGLVFVHGGAAHAHWWSFLVPLLADSYRIAAMDLSGHGDSDRREAYPLSSWSAEIMAVADDLGASGPPVVVGHSMGGFVAIGTGAVYGADLAGLVILDSPVTAPDPEIDAARGGKVFGPLRVYPDLESGLARFRTVPEQAHYLPYVIDHVARHSLRPVEGGWSWKYDPEIFVPTRSEARDLLQRVQCRVALFRAEHGLVTPEIGDYMYECLGRVAPVVEIPEAGHHLMLDQPLLLLTALRTLLADWEHSSPLTR